jgi:heterodisulfide reductase subunit A
MVDAARHPQVEIMAYSEVERVDGYIGNFRVQVTQKARYVIQERCTGCGECAEVCPIEAPNWFDVDIAPHKAIDVPHGQSVPLIYAVDLENCIRCYQCVTACGQRDAIDFSQEPQTAEVEVGAIIAATGAGDFDPTVIPEYGYSRYPNVVTAMELERLANSSGPTVGHLIRPSDGQTPRSVAFVQCVGSRDKRYNEYCSGYCCMFSIKNAILLKQTYPEMDVSIFYMDIRTPFKGYEEFYNRARAMGIRFLRGRPAQITQDPATRNLFVEVEDQDLGQVLEVEVDMVVLATALIPQVGTGEVASILNLSRSPSGFFMEYHPKLRPMDSPTDGVFLAGTAQGPKDIPASVAQGSAAASRAARVLNSDTWEIEPIIARVEPGLCISAQGRKCGLCARACPYGAITVEVGQAAVITPAKCHGCGACVAECPHNAISQDHFTDAQIVAQMRELLRDQPESKILALMCHWCSYGGADNAGTSHFQYPPDSRGIRVMCSARMDQDLVLEAFRRGAGMVLVSGCHPQDCHYITGQQVAARRFDRITRTLERLGINSERFRVEWISAAEGDKYARVITEMSEKLASLDQEALRAENDAARVAISKRLVRWKSLPEMVALLAEEEAVPV